MYEYLLTYCFLHGVDSEQNVHFVCPFLSALCPFGAVVIPLRNQFGFYTLCTPCTTVSLYNGDCEDISPMKFTHENMYVFTFYLFCVDSRFFVKKDCNLI